MQTLLDEARRFAPDDRIRLAERIIESVAEADVPDLSADQQAELDRRLVRIEATGSLGKDWETVKGELQVNLQQSV